MSACAGFPCVTADQVPDVERLVLFAGHAAIANLEVQSREIGSNATGSAIPLQLRAARLTASRMFSVVDELIFAMTGPARLALYRRAGPLLSAI